MRLKIQVVTDLVDKNKMDIFSIGLQGLNQAQGQLEKSASDIAHSSIAASSTTTEPVDTVDISEAMISMLSAKTTFEANLKTIEVGKELAKTVIDIKA